ncbi:MAG: DUF1385 domain-containing protein [Anaerolineaceae bacterium]
MNEKLPSYGGQALIEGVLMRGSKTVAAAMRAPSGEIIITSEPLQGIYKFDLLKLPFLRGLVILWDSLGLGMRFLALSANTQTGEDEKIEGPALYGTLAVSLAIGIGLFFVLPAFIGQVFGGWLKWDSWGINLAEGLLRIAIALGYIWGVGKIPDIARVFAYHGAEHKTINGYESGIELTPENIQVCSLEHPRCGTSFLLTIIVLSVIVFSLLGPLPGFWRYLIRILLVPPLASLAYEYIRWTSKHLDSQFVRWLIRPNLALQKLTTREPSLEMLEVAITAFKTMLSKEKEPVSTVVP